MDKKLVNRLVVATAAWLGSVVAVSGASVYTHDFTSLKDLTVTGGVSLQIGPAPGGKLGNALKISNAGQVTNSGVTLDPAVTLPNAATILFRVYIASRTDFQAVYTYPPGEGLRYMDAGFLQGSCGEGLAGTWQVNTWYTIALVVPSSGTQTIYAKVGADAQITTADQIGTVCGGNATRPLTHSYFFNYGGDLYVADYAVNEGVDFSLCGNGQSFDAGLEGWSGGTNDGISWISSGGLCQGGYHQASKSGYYPSHEPYEDPGRSALTANLASRFGHVIEYSYYVKDLSTSSPGAGPVIHAFIDYSHGSPYTQWQRQLLSAYPVDWTKVGFVIDVNWTDTQAAAAGWSRTAGSGTWAAMFSVSGVSGTNTGLRTVFGTGSGSYTGTRVTGVDGVTINAGRLAQPMGTYCIPFTVTSALPFSMVPLDPSISFSQIIQQAGIEGVLDPNSIKVRDLASGQTVPVAIERFDYNDTLSVEWVVGDPSHTQYEICFTTVSRSVPVITSEYTPMIGVGDLLHYNAGVPRPVMPGFPAASADLTGDGLPDLVGTWNYGRRPGDRWDGPVVYPRVGGLDQFTFGAMLRIYEVPDIRYSRVEPGDFDKDGLADLVFAPSSSGTLTLYHNTGDRHPNGMPVFAANGTAGRNGGWNPRVVDLDNDGKLDIVCAAGFPNAETGAMESTGYLRNVSGTNAWPPTFQDMGTLSTVGPLPTFFDVDGDGLKDAVVLVTDPTDPGLSGFKVAWQKNQGGSPPRFAASQLLSEVNDLVWRPFDLASMNDGPQPGLIVQHHNWEQISLFTRRPGASGPPYFQLHGLAGSLSAEFELSDQAWPFPCDWDGDGDWDLLVGGGYGWPRILINNGTNDHPAFSEAQYIYSGGQPIRLLRNVILGQPYLWHNMGYPYPAYVDWDGDGLPDLVIPNETNRIFWYKNIGTRQTPQFGLQQQLLVDGYGDSAALRQLSAQRALTAVYPKEQEEPFFWRTGAAFADFNSDGIMDMATHDGWTRVLTLFTQYRDNNGQLKLRKSGPLKLTDGRNIEESIVGRSSGWTESFKAIDWNGDGLPDIVYSLSGKSGDTVYLLLNAGTAQAPVFSLPQPVRPFGQPIHITDHGPNVGVADLDGDGRPEVIGCTEWSVYAFYRGTALAMSQRPTHSLGTVYRAGVPADFNGDGDVDGDDFGLLQICLTGPYRGPPAPGCEGADLDNDGDVDVADLLVFLSCVSGEGIPAQLHCGG